MAESLRKLFGNPGVQLDGDLPWSMQNPIEYTLIWILVLIVVCAPLAVVAYNRRTAE